MPTADPFAFDPLPGTPPLTGPPIPAQLPSAQSANPLPGGTPGEPAPVATTPTIPNPPPKPTGYGSFSPVDPNTPQEYIPAAVRNGLFPQQDMATLGAMPSDQAFDTAVRLNVGDVRWPLEMYKGVDPDAAAKVWQFAQTHNTSFEIANTVDPKDREALDIAQNIIAEMSAKDANGNLIYPATNAWLKNPTNMLMARDDVAALAQIEQTVKDRQQAGEGSTMGFLRSFGSGIDYGTAGVLKLPGLAINSARNLWNNLAYAAGTNDKSEGLVSGASQSDRAPIAPLQPLPKWADDLWGSAPAVKNLGDIMSPVSAEGQTLKSEIEQRNPVGAMRVATSTLAGAIPGILASFIDPALGLGVFSAGAAGGEYQQAEDEGKSPGQAADDGSISFLANALGGKLLGHTASFEAAQKAFSAPSIGGGVLGMVGKLVKQTLLGGTKNAVAQTGIQAATDVGNLATGNSHALDNEKENLINAAITGAVTDAALTVPFGAIDGAMRVRQAQVGAEQNANLVAATNGSKMVARDPDALADHITKSAEAAGTPMTVGVDGDKLTTFFQGNTDGLQSFADDMGTTPEAIQQAAQTGSEVPLPIGPYTAKYAGKSDLDAAINQDLRYTPGGLSAAELPAEMARVQAMNDAINTELDKTANGQGSKLPDQVATMRDTLMQDKAAGGMGYSSDQADSQIAVLMAGLQNLAGQHGEGVEQTVNRLGLGLTVGNVEGTDGGLAIKTGTPEEHAVAQESRGSVTFSKGKTIIHLAKTADLSTFLHETGHVLFREMHGMVEQGIANDQTKADLQTLHDFAGVEPGGRLDTPGEEKIIKAFEGYLREGKAPSIELSGPFARIRSWLTSVYRTITALGTEPTDAVRQVFDRMLASNEDIADAHEYYSRTNQVLDLIKADDADKAKLREKAAAVQQSQLDKQTSAYLKSYLKAVGGVSAVREAAKKEVEESKIYKTLNDAREGKISEESVLGVLGKAGLAEMKAKYPGLVTKNGEHSLESLAADHGFDSPETLADNMTAAVSKAEAIKNYTQRLVAVKEQELRDEITKRGATPADAAMHTNGSLSYLIAETQLMAKQLAGKGRAPIRFDERVYRDAARQAIDGMNVKRAVRHDLFAKAEARFSRQVLGFAKKGQWEDALKARQKQMAQHAMVQEAIAARDMRRAIENRYGKTKLSAKLKATDRQFRDPALQILSTYGLTDSKPATPYDLTQLNAVDSALFSQLPTWIVRGQNATDDYRNFSFGQLQDIDKAARSVLAFGSDIMKSAKAGQEQSKQATVAKSIENMAKLKDVDVAQKGDGKLRYARLATADWLKSGVLKMQFVSDIADNFDQNGVMSELYKRILTAEADATDTRRSVWEPLEPDMRNIQKGIERINKQYGSAHFDIPELPLPDAMRKAGKGKWTGDMLISAMLNTGNDGNISSLKNGYNFTDAQLAKIASHFTTEELKSVQHIWDAGETLYEPLKKATEHVYDRDVSKVAPTRRTWEARDGIVDLAGGYYPLIFDHDIDDTAGRFNEDDIMKGNTAAMFRSVKPGDGMTKDRVTGHSLPPLLAMSVFARNVDDTTHFIHYAAVMRDLNAVTSDPEWKSKFTDKFGNAQYKETRNYLKDQAVPARTPMSEVMRGVDKVMSYTKMASTSAILGFRLLTPILWRTSIFNTASELGRGGHESGWRSMVEGYKFLGTKGLGTSLLGMSNTESAKKVYEKSAFMRNNAKNFDLAIRESIERTLVGEKEFKIAGKTFTMSDVRAFQFAWATANDRAIKMPGWAGGYGKYYRLMADPNDSPEDTERKAIEYADSVISRSQPSARRAEMNAFQRKEGALHYFMIFQTWSQNYGNRLLYNNRAWKEGAMSNSAYTAHIVQEVFAEPIARIMLASAFAGTVPEWYQYPLAPIENILQWMPGFNAIPGMLESGFGTDEILPGPAEPLKRANNLRNDLKSHEFDPGQFAWDLARMTDFFLGTGLTNTVKDLVNTAAAAEGAKKKPLR